MSAGWPLPRWLHPGVTPWLALALFAPDAAGHQFTLGHWGLLVGAAAALSVLGLAAARRPDEGLGPGESRASLGGLAAWLLACLAVSVLAFHGFNTRYLAQDTAYFNQMMWSTVRSPARHLLEAGLFQETFYSPPARSHFAVHVSPFLLFLAPLYALAPRFETLLVLRNLALGAGAWVLFRELRGPLGARAAVVAAAAWLLHPNTVVMASGEFNEMPFAVPVVVWAVGAAWRGALTEALLASALCAAVREDAVLPAAVAALVVALRRRRWSWAVLGAACGAWFVLAYRVVMPAFAPSGGQLVASLYQGMGGSPAGVAVHLLTHPRALVGLFGEPARLFYLAALVRSFLLLPLFSWATLAAGPTVLALLLIPLQGYGDVLGLWRHYSTLSVAVLALAGGLGAAFWARRRASGRERAALALTLSWLLLCGAVLTEVQTIGLTWIARARPAPLAGTYRELLREIPPGAPVAAVYQLTPALSQRRHVYALRFHGATAGLSEAAILAHAAYVVADLDTLRARRLHACGEGYTAFLARLRSDPEWRLTRETGGLALLVNAHRAPR